MAAIVQQGPRTKPALHFAQVTVVMEVVAAAAAAVSAKVNSFMDSRDTTFTEYPHHARRVRASRPLARTRGCQRHAPAQVDVVTTWMDVL